MVILPTLSRLALTRRPSGGKPGTCDGFRDLGWYKKDYSLICLVCLKGSSDDGDSCCGHSAIVPPWVAMEKRGLVQRAFVTAGCWVLDIMSRATAAEASSHKNRTVKLLTPVDNLFRPT